MNAQLEDEATDQNYARELTEITTLYTQLQRCLCGKLLKERRSAHALHNLEESFLWAREALTYQRGGAVGLEMGKPASDS